MSEAKTGDETFEALVAGAAAKDRSNITKHLAACDAEPEGDHAALWRRLAVSLRKLAPMPVQTVGQQAVLFFVPDGKYRMQVFALEDGRNGKLVVYLPDVLEAGIRDRILTEPPASARRPAGDDDEAGGVPAVEYPIRGKRGQTLRVEALTGSNTPDPPPHVRHMLGWNRRAIRLVLPAIADAPQADAAEALCALAAKSWAATAK